MTERDLQKQCIKWFRYAFPQGLIFAVPNGGSRNLLEAKHLKEEGVLAGVSDLIVIFPQKIIFVEMKIGKNPQTAHQKEFQKKVENLGFVYAVCRSFEDFSNTIKQHQTFRYFNSQTKKNAQTN